MAPRLPAALLAAAALTLSLAQGAPAAGGNYTITGGTKAEQATVRAALHASGFNWSILPQTIQVTIQPGAGDYATPGGVFIDPQLLDMGTISWGIVQHEFAHQIDFLLLDDSERRRLAQAIGGVQWFPSNEDLPHASYGCERFASLVSWAFWASPENVLHPSSTHDEAGGMPAPAFRALLSEFLTVVTPPTVSAPQPVKAYAPAITKALAKTRAAN